MPRSNVIFLILLTFFGADAWADDRDAQPISEVRRFDFDVALQDWDLFSGLAYSPTAPDTFFTALRSGDVGKWLATASAPLWRLRLDVLQATVEDLAVSPDGRIVAVVGGPNLIRFLNTTDGSALSTAYEVGAVNPLPLVPHFTSIAFSPSGKYFAVGDANGCIYIWAAGQPAALGVLRSRDLPIKQLTFSQTGEFLVSTSSREVLIWNWANESIVTNIGEDVASGPFWAESIYLPPYERIMTITTFHDVVLYDLSSREVLRRYPLAQGDDDDGPGDPLLTVTDESLTQLWRFYKQPLVERLDIDTGAPAGAFIDPSFFDGGALSVHAYVRVARKPRTPNEFVAGLLSWRFNILSGELTMHSRLRYYRMAL